MAKPAAGSEFNNNTFTCPLFLKVTHSDDLDYTIIVVLRLATRLLLPEAVACFGQETRFTVSDCLQLLKSTSAWHTDSFTLACRSLLLAGNGTCRQPYLHITMDCPAQWQYISGHGYGRNQELMDAESHEELE